MVKSVRKALKNKICSTEIINIFDKPKDVEKIIELTPEALEKWKENCDDSFAFAIAPVASFVQFLALMPVYGVSTGDARKLVFKWASFRTIYTSLYILYGVFLTVLFTKDTIEQGISTNNIVGPIYFAYTTICAIIFLMIAVRWATLMRIWQEKEKPFLSFPYKVHGWKLSKKVRATAVAVIFLAYAEHSFFLSNQAFNRFKTYERCNKTEVPFIEFFLKDQFAVVYKTLPFNIPIGILVELINLSYTFGWNYMELFVMMISLAVANRFKQINDRLEGIRGKIISETVWGEIRLDYVAICELLETVDHELRYLILLSNLNNLYFICGQLHAVTSSLPYTINYVYFWFSLIYLFGRTLAAQFLAASAHDASNYPLNVLRDVPYEGWCIEVQRFIDQIRAQTMAFSGHKFFYLTRKTILAMLATICTYELVLLQFEDPNEEIDTSVNFNECD